MTVDGVTEKIIVSNNLQKDISNTKEKAIVVLSV